MDQMGDNRARALYDHILALERLQEAKDEASADYNERKKLAKEDGFDPNVIEAIKKRRKNGAGQTMAFDAMLREYEQVIALQEAGQPVEAADEPEDEGELSSLAEAGSRVFDDVPFDNPDQPTPVDASDYAPTARDHDEP